MHIQAAHHIGIVTANLARLEAFYATILGLPVTMRWHDVGIVFLDAGGLLLELIQQPTAGPATWDQASSQTYDPQPADAMEPWLQRNSQQSERQPAGAPAEGGARELEQQEPHLPEAPRRRAMEVERQEQDAGQRQVRRGQEQADQVQDQLARKLTIGLGLNHVALQVEGVDQAYVELLALGVQGISAPESFQSFRIAFVADPDGNIVELIERINAYHDKVDG